MNREQVHFRIKCFEANKKILQVTLLPSMQVKSNLKESHRFSIWDKILCSSANTWQVLSTFNNVDCDTANHDRTFHCLFRP